MTDKRPDQIFRKTKIISTLGKYTSNLVLNIDSLIVLGSDMQVDRARHEHIQNQYEHYIKQRAQSFDWNDQEGAEADQGKGGCHDRFEGTSDSHMWIQRKKLSKMMLILKK